MFSKIFTLSVKLLKAAPIVTTVVRVAVKIATVVAKTVKRVIQKDVVQEVLQEEVMEPVVKAVNAVVMLAPALNLFFTQTYKEGVDMVQATVNALEVLIADFKMYYGAEDVVHNV